ncbi:hypothetical protein JMK10_15525 [Rhodovulum sulfidophilum]|uniref:hypothetical protein n=1 Tax=Rhodovulum sulfidophilum TaxID=35806 RepID=UPI0019215C11|nr:hypothetical protein [Rhodovulum sulfidophilum]MBL3574510.1 hypothetical protein [Rhodovulum sulfidophilum]MCE8432084.1 hypothetical protein [Rhodovulum sulfidophilum]MCF4118185.1 hypothetical protein [Rhodovulum sulfidophilum]
MTRDRAIAWGARASATALLAALFLVAGNKIGASQPYDVALATEAAKGWPILLNLSGNGKSLPQQIVQGGADDPVPGGGRQMLVSFPAADDLAFDIHWRELRSGRSYEAQVRLTTSDLANQLAFIHDGINLPLILRFGAHGAVSIYTLSAQRLNLNVRLADSVAPIAAEDYPRIASVCAQRTPAPAVARDPVNEFGRSFDVAFDVKRYQKERALPPPTSHCPDPQH